MWYIGRKFINVHDIISFLFSAGIGRTGTFIALDYILEEGATEQTVNVKDYVMSLRHQRGKSIQKSDYKATDSLSVICETYD